MVEKTYEELSKVEKVEMILTDSDKYIDLVPEGHWLLLLDGIAKIGAYEPD